MAILYQGIPATAFNNTLALRPFGKQPGFIPEIIDLGPAVSPMHNVRRHRRQKEEEK
jgi:hypothetical protein